MTFGTDIKQWYSIQTPANLDLDLKKFDLVNRYGTSLSQMPTDMFHLS